jgi:hypothetical protein
VIDFMTDLKKRIAIMQPYFLPYVGYFQLIANVDEFVVYDDIKYTKKSWINRNRLVLNGSEKIFTLPLKKGSDYLDIKDRYISETYSPDNLFYLFKQGFIKSPNWPEVSPVLEEIVFKKESNLFHFVLNAINCVNKLLEIKTKITISSTLKISEKLKGVERVISICKELGATDYLNAIGGRDLYRTEDFVRHDLNLYFLKSKLSNFGPGKVFVPGLSIVDLLFNADISQREFQITKDFDLVP